jgi:type IX secretion system PorP/SprF family membrane protein
MARPFFKRGMLLYYAKWITVKRGILILLLAFFFYRAIAQDPQFSQFYSNYLYLAPSFAGLTDKNRISFNYRNQWPEIKHGYQTYSVSFDKFIEKFSSGIGVLAYQDVAGSGRMRTTSLGIQYSFDFSITESWHARPGLHFNYTERGIDFNRLIWADQFTTTGSSVDIEPHTNEIRTMEKAGDIDFSTSFLTYSNKFWLGAAVDHLLKPNQSLYLYEGDENNQAKVPIKYSLFGGVKFVRPEKLLRPIPTSIQLAFIYKQQEQFRQLDLGVYWYHSPLVIGFWYRGIPLYKEVFNRDAFTILVGIKTGDINIGYSYDFTISKLITNTGGSHEVSVSYVFKTKPMKHKVKMVPCPEF